MGSFPNNKKEIELQVMNRFSRDNDVLNMPKPTEFSGVFNSIFKLLRHAYDQRGTLNDMASPNIIDCVKLSSRQIDPTIQIWHNVTNVVNLRIPTVYTLSSYELESLRKTYMYMYPLVDFNSAVVSPSSLKVTELSISGNIYGSDLSRNNRSSYIVAHWASNDGNIKSFDEMELSPRPGIIKYFLKHTLTIHVTSYEHWLAFCDWFLSVPDHIRFEFGKPLELWHNNLYELAGASSFIPVSRIFGKFVHARLHRHSKDLMVIVPVVKNSCF